MTISYPTWHLDFEKHLINQLIAAHNPAIQTIHPQMRPLETKE